MKKKMIGLILVSLLLLFACSSDDYSGNYADYDMAVSDEASYQSEIGMMSDEQADFAIEPTDPTAPDLERLSEATRKIIYNAYLDLEVKQYLDVVQIIEETVNEMNGYIVSNQTSRLDDQLHEGHLQLRIPQESLDLFFNFLEDNDQILINHRELTGKDVTDQYVDLATRLESREQLEARLLTFMEEAETTEDLLNISRDLANVQYEIESIKGQMNYIDNRSDLATVELYIIEQQTEFAHEQNLNIWQRTKEQWLNSYNRLLIGGANLFVFIVGNLPVIILIVVISGLVYFAYRKRRGRRTIE
ncbi:DUF4349 domain-containing protein [Amphibacillus indicireducens]|uniref:DUF4349 domain-containing protein n=1 Tax=Amphibacillus indicireducens TaxID=1076330 RepID=A0ABP7VM35_9BACI